MSMSPSCQRCGLSSSGPQAFLLTCRGCSRTWHHRCHQPPVEDQVLIQLIRATRSGDTSNDLHTWTCRRCKKRVSETPASRETTATSLSCEDSKGYTTPPTSDTAPLAPTADGHVKQESSTTVVESRVAPARHLIMTNKREMPKRPMSSPKPSVSCEDRGDKSSSDATSDTQLLADVRIQKESYTKRPLLIAAKRAGGRKLEIRTSQRDETGPAQLGDANVPTHRIKAARKFVDRASDSSPTSSVDTPLSNVTVLDRTQRPSSPKHVKAARKLDNTASESAASTEGDVEMQVDTFPDLATPRASQVHFSIRPEVHATHEQQGVIPPPEAVIQPQVNQAAADEFDDDPEDLYGPPVERRIIRILPSLAEELREQQRRAAAEKEKRWAPLAPDWILARHVNDPLWKDIPTQGRRRRKPIARKLGNNGLNVDELVGCFTVQNWVREHKF